MSDVTSWKQKHCGMHKASPSDPFICPCFSIVYSSLGRVILSKFADTMAPRFQVIVFGDLSVPYHAELQRLLSDKDSCTLVSLFSDAHRALRSEISRLPPSQRSCFPHVSNLAELLIARQSSQVPNCALDSALVCLCHIASFIAYVLPVCLIL